LQDGAAGDTATSDAKLWEALAAVNLAGACHLCDIFMCMCM